MYEEFNNEPFKLADINRFFKKHKIFLKPKSLFLYLKDLVDSNLLKTDRLMVNQYKYFITFELDTKKLVEYFIPDIENN